MSIEEIIAKVKSRPELWQLSHPFYKHRIVTAKIWQEISEELNINELTLRKKWKHLKDQYRKEHKKVLNNLIPKSYWLNYDRLYFLSEEYQRHLLLETKGQTTEATEASDNDKNDNSDSDERPLKAKRPRKRVLKKGIPAPTVPLRPKLPSFKTPEGAGINALVTKSPDAGKLNFILSRLTAMETSIENYNTSSKDTMRYDSDYTYILSLLPIMKKLSEIQKLQFRGKMNDWLLEILTQNEYTESNDYKVFLQNQIVSEIPPTD